MPPATERSRDGLTVFIVAGEDSGDLHAANLIRRMSELRPDVRFEGFGGGRMAAAGCRLHADILHLAAMGFTFLQNISAFFGLIRKFYKVVNSDTPPDAVVVVDFPGFNFILLRLARSRGIPVAYYICPQIWAWGPWRRKKILRLTDLLMVILPFEESYYAGPGTNAIFVGHPLADALEENPPPEELAAELRTEFGLNDEAIIGLFPGSRMHEVQQLLPLFRTTIERMELEPGSRRLMVSCRREEFRPLIESQLGSLELPVDIVKGDAHRLMAACDFALVASGTATLELAYYEKPMIVLYRIGRFAHFMYHRLRMSPFIALANILAGGEVVPEEITYREEPSPEKVTRAKALLQETPERAQCLEELREVKREVFKPGGTLRAAQTLSEFLSRRVETKLETSKSEG